MCVTESSLLCLSPLSTFHPSLYLPPSLSLALPLFTLHLSLYIHLLPRFISLPLIVYKITLNFRVQISHRRTYTSVFRYQWKLCIASYFYFSFTLSSVFVRVLQFAWCVTYIICVTSNVYRVWTLGCNACDLVCDVWLCGVIAWSGVWVWAWSHLCTLSFLQETDLSSWCAMCVMCDMCDVWCVMCEHDHTSVHSLLPPGNRSLLMVTFVRLLSAGRTPLHE